MMPQSGIRVLLTEINPSLATSVCRAFMSENTMWKAAGRNRKVWTGQASRLSLCCLTKKKREKNSVNSWYNNAFGLSAVWVGCDKCRSRYQKNWSACTAPTPQHSAKLKKRTSVHEHTRTSEDTENGGGVPVLWWLRSTDVLWPSDIWLPAGAPARARALNCSHSSSSYC